MQCKWNGTNTELERWRKRCACQNAVAVTTSNDVEKHFTITTEILSRSLAKKFIVNKWTDTWIYKLCDASTSESGQFDNLLS